MSSFDLWLLENESILLLGVMLNILGTLGLGIYKSANLNPKQIRYLMETYPVKKNPLKLFVYWFMPYWGYVMALKEAYMIQRYLRHGKAVFDYVEDKLKNEIQ